MRRAIPVVLMVTGVLLLAQPAQAKMDGTAFITGPGIGGPSSGGSGGSGSGSIKLDGSDGGGFPVLSGLLDPAQHLTSTPEGELGPRYTARLRVNMPNRQPDVVQHLYPFVEGGPVIYTAPGQRWIFSPDGEAPSGWFRPAPELMEELWDRGFPRTSPVSLEAPASEGQPQSAPATQPSAVVWGVVLLVGLLVAGALAGRRRAAVRRAA
jgi:hypothetical protein